MPYQQYRIKPGDSLSKIAPLFGFPDWRPIWNYNTRIRKTLTSGDPALVHTGVEITIPRTLAEYDLALASLIELLTGVEIDMTGALRDLKSEKTKADTVGTRVDIAADVLMAGKGAVKAGIKFGPRYAKYVLRKESLDVLSKTAITLAQSAGQSDDVEVHSLGKAVADSSLDIGIKTTRATVVGNALHIHSGNFSSGRFGRTFGKNLGKTVIKKTAVAVSKKTGQTIEMQHAFGEAVGLVCDLALKGIEGVSPSNVAKYAVFAWTGEHQDDTYDRAVQLVKMQAKRSHARVIDAIKKVGHERKLVYEQN